MPQVERAKLSDFPAWLALARTVEDLFGAEMADDPEYQLWLKRSIARRTAFCVHEQGKLAGAMQFGAGWIGWLAVDARFRRCGVGRALVEYAIGDGKQDIRVITFGVDHPHPLAGAARALYQSMGFTSSTDQTDPWSDGTPRETLIWQPKS